MKIKAHLISLWKKLSVKKRFCIGGILLISGFIIWRALPYQIKAYLGDEEAKSKLAFDFLEKHLDEVYRGNCEVGIFSDLHSYSYSLEKAITLYLELAKSGDKSSVLALASNGSFDREFPLFWNGCVEQQINFISISTRRALKELFKKDKTAIENWIGDSEENLHNVIKIYGGSGYYDLGDEYTDQLIAKAANDFESKGEFGKLLRLANLNRGSQDLRREIYQKVFEKGNEEQKREAKFNIAKINKDEETLKMLVKENYLPAALYFADRFDFPLPLKEFYLLGIKTDYQGEKEINRALYHLTLRPDAKEKLRYYDLYKSNGIKYLEEAGCKNITIYPYRNICVYELSDLYWAEQKYDKAEEIYKEILSYDKTRTWAYVRLGDIYYRGLGRRQDLQKAQEYYGKACDLKDQEGCSRYREVNEKIR